jgi:hypothetical protein
MTATCEKFGTAPAPYFSSRTMFFDPRGIWQQLDQVHHQPIAAQSNTLFWIQVRTTYPTLPTLPAKMNYVPEKSLQILPSSNEHFLLMWNESMKWITKFWVLVCNTPRGLEVRSLSSKSSCWIQPLSSFYVSYFSAFLCNSYNESYSLDTLLVLSTATKYWSRRNAWSIYLTCTRSYTPWHSAGNSFHASCTVYLHFVCWELCQWDAEAVELQFVSLVMFT